MKTRVRASRGGVLNTWLLNWRGCGHFVFYSRRRRHLPASHSHDRGHKLAPPVQPLGADALQTALLLRDETAVVRDLAKQISSHPRSAA